MSGEQLQTYLAALASSLTVGVLVPLAILACIAWALWVLIGRASRTEGFRLADMLCDENGKASSARLISFATWAITSWVLAVVVLTRPDLLIEAMVVYLVFWSGVPAAKTIAQLKYGQAAAPPQGGGQP